MASVHFRELARCKIGLNKYLVVSERVDDNKVSIAQQVEAPVDGDEVIRMFMKNAIITNDQGIDEIIEMLLEVKEKRKAKKV